MQVASCCCCLLFNKGCPTVGSFRICGSPLVHTNSTADCDINVIVVVVLLLHMLREVVSLVCSYLCREFTMVHCVLHPRVAMA
jgi:hypothetical protein